MPRETKRTLQVKRQTQWTPTRKEISRWTNSDSQGKQVEPKSKETRTPRWTKRIKGRCWL